MYLRKPGNFFTSLLFAARIFQLCSDAVNALLRLLLESELIDANKRASLDLRLREDLLGTSPQPEGGVPLDSSGLCAAKVQASSSFRSLGGFIPI